MNIVAIDPGPERSAILKWNGDRVVNPMILNNGEIRDCVASMAVPEMLAVEMIACYGMPVGAETFNTCLFIGQLKEIWLQKLKPFQLVYRREVKMHFCGTMKAKDPNIRQALIDKFGPVGTRKSPGKLYGVSSHLWAALAVAVYVQETIRP